MLAHPSILDAWNDDPPVRSAEDWRRRRGLLLKALEAEVYGPLPDAIAPKVKSKTQIAPENAGGVPGVEQWEIDLAQAGRFHLVLVRPPRDKPAPVVLVQNFCGNRAAFPSRPEAIAAPLQYLTWMCRYSALDTPTKTVFGKNINGPPFELAAQRGYALALMYGGDVVPDHPEHARPALAKFAAAETGAIAAWAWAFSRAVDVLTQDARIDAKRICVWGQSRNGKAALLAAATDERVAAGVVLQSGRGGDALTRHRMGESVAQIMKSYPHWFSPRFATYREADPPVDQEHLIALVAPRPLLLTRARQDGWADPVGGRLAAEAAKPAFELLGAEPPGEFVRDGFHGIHPSDWQATLDFLDARMR